MNILVVNCGSSSVKYKLISMENEVVLAQGEIESIGTENSLVKYKIKGKNEVKDITPISNHEEGIEFIINLILDPEKGALKDKSDIAGVGHRVVHGGDKFSESVLVDDEVKAKIYDCIDLAPLHNPNNFKGIQAIETLLPGVPQVASFDTAFHHTLPDYAYIYPLPYSEYVKHGIRRFGFHGTSHKYIAARSQKLLKNTKSKVISAHLGNGASITAIKDGKSIDTSMGFTPLEGLMMGTRSGDIDPAILFYLASKCDMPFISIDNLLNKRSGILGISGISNDMRELVKAIEEGDKRAKLAMQMYVYRIKKYIGSYMTVLNGADAVVFTAGVGENNIMAREFICADMDSLGIKLDKSKNKEMRNGKEGFINTEDSKVKILVISTNEELVIARDTIKLIKNEKLKMKN